MKQQEKQNAVCPPGALECDGSRLVLLLAQLRRQGRTPGEPVKVGPNRWRVYPSGSTGEFQPDPDGGGDRVFGFDSFTDGATGRMEEC
jgi:hypothetical protein